MRTLRMILLLTVILWLLPWMPARAITPAPTTTRLAAGQTATNGAWLLRTLPPGNGPSRLLADPGQTGVLYAQASTGSSSILYRSPDGGQTWTALREWTTSYAAYLAVSPAISDTLFIADRYPDYGGDYYLARSTDGGQTWTPYGQEGWPRGLGFHDLAVAANGVVYAMTIYDDLYRTTGLTDTWTWLAHFTNTQTATLPAAPDLTTGETYPPTVTTGGDGHLVYVFDADYTWHASADGGATWQVVTLLGRTHAGVLIQNNHTVYAEAGGLGLLRSGDAGATWAQTWPHRSGSALIAGPGWLVLSGSADQITVLHDQGATWAADYLDLPAPRYTSPVVDATGTIYLVTLIRDTNQYHLYCYDPAAPLGPYHLYFPFVMVTPAPRPYQVAVDRINFWRAIAGLQPVQDHPATRCAAENHANYLALNATGDAHYETAGYPGFTGERLQDRLAYCGYAEPWLQLSEVVVGPPEMGTVAAVDGWLATVYHRSGVLEADATAVGYGEGGANVLDSWPGQTPTGVWQPARHTRFVLWPAPGQTDVPSYWNGLEIPDPLPPGSTKPVGYPVSLTWDKFAVTPTLALLAGPTGTVLCHPNPAQMYPYQAYPYYVFLIPVAPLAYATTYTATVAGDTQDGPFNFTWSFTTREEFGTGPVVGLVTDHGQPAADVPLQLHRLVDHGPAYTVVATTTTDWAGRYSFPNPPISYTDCVWVSYQNDDRVPGRVRRWYASAFAYCPADYGGSQPGGDLDLTDVVLGEPDTANPQPEPVTFRWTPRGGAGETYAILFRDPYEFRARVALTAAESAAGQVAVTRPADLPPGTYAWTFQIRGPYIIGQSGVGQAGTSHTVTWP